MIKRKRKLPENYKYANMEYTSSTCPWCGEKISTNILLENSKHDFLKMYLCIHKQIKMGNTDISLNNYDSIFTIECPKCSKKIAGCLDLSYKLNAIEKIES